MQCFFMNNYHSLFKYLILLCCLSGCHDTSDENSLPNYWDTKDSISVQATDTSQGNLEHIHSTNEIHESLQTNSIISLENWRIEDFIINKKDQNSSSIKRTMEAIRDEWESAPNPIIARFRGCDFGDYFHLNFEDAQGNIFDFGFGDNAFGQIELYNTENFEDNPNYLNKKFEIYWSWKITTFPCCDGEFDQVEAYIPSITNLVLTH